MKFINTGEYHTFKAQKFSRADELVIGRNPAFLLDNDNELERFSSIYDRKSEIYFENHPPFIEIIDKIRNYADFL